MELTINIIADLIVLGLMVLGVVLGAKKGFIKCIAGLLILIIAIVGARWLSAIVTDPITAFIYPRVEESIESKINKQIIDPSGISIVDKAVEEASGTATQMLKVTAEAFVRSVVHAAAFLVCFLILTLLLRLLIDVIDKVFDLPLLKSVNGILGGAFALMEVVVLLFLVPYLAKHMGINWFEKMSEDTILLNFFVHSSPFDLIQLLLS